MAQWQATSTRLYIRQDNCFPLLKGILYCACSNIFNIVSNLAKHNNMFNSTEQQDCQEAFNIICDILDKVTHGPLYSNGIYTTRINDNFIGIMSIKASCINCGVTSYCHTEYKEIYVPLHHSIEESILSEFTRLQFCNKCNNNVVHNCHRNGLQHRSPPDDPDSFISLQLILPCCLACFYDCKFHICLPISAHGL